MNNKNIVPIFFSVDDNYIPFLTIALKSLKNNSNKENFYDIHILNTGISEENKALVNLICGTDNISVQFDDITSRLSVISQKLHTRDYYSKSTYYRLFIPNMFPQYDKALYLDADIAILGDIANLYNVDIKDNYVGAIPDESVSIVPEFSKYTKDFLGITYDKYFNAGILVMNLKVLRDEKFEDQFLYLLQKVKFNVAQDQDYLNVICKNKTHYIDSSWNKMPFKCNATPTEKLNLIHYNLSFKPWHYDGILYEEVFWKIAKEINMFDKLQEIKSLFSDADKEKDIMVGENLKKMALEQSYLKDAYTQNIVFSNLILAINEI